VNERLVQFNFAGGREERLDKFLVACLPEFSRSRLQALIRAGMVTVDGHAASKAGQILDHESQIEVFIPAPEPTELIPESIPLDICFENQDFLVVNKPAGMVVHPAAGHTSGTLVHAVRAPAPDIQGVGGELRPGIVHRLDKDTSGLILIAKNDRAHRWLQNQFRNRQVEKTYVALVDGAPPTRRGRIEAAIGRDPAHRKKMAVVPPGKGRLAISEYLTLETFPGHTLLEVHPVTGRTHQIRLHLAYLGCPVTGDTVYGRKKVSLPLARQFLHAARLQIQLQGEKSERVFEAPLSLDLEEVLNGLRSESG
jgi:23S rRNA pseudouridine1911/1915/1917 synthase